MTTQKWYWTFGFLYMRGENSKQNDETWRWSLLGMLEPSSMPKSECQLIFSKISERCTFWHWPAVGDQKWKSKFEKSWDFSHTNALAGAVPTYIQLQYNFRCQIETISLIYIDWNEALDVFQLGNNLFSLADLTESCQNVIRFSQKCG